MPAIEIRVDLYRRLAAIRVAVVAAMPAAK
jgi:hypothetical protein